MPMVVKKSQNVLDDLTFDKKLDLPTEGNPIKTTLASINQRSHEFTLINENRK